ncbi:MAG: hypothetical protein Kapaf2KO_01650 [Candidatus Kapaibacteriales bacterium]
MPTATDGRLFLRENQIKVLSIEHFVSSGANIIILANNEIDSIELGSTSDIPIFQLSENMLDFEQLDKLPISNYSGIEGKYWPQNYEVPIIYDSLSNTASVDIKLSPTASVIWYRGTVRIDEANTLQVNNPDGLRVEVRDSRYPELVLDGGGDFVPFLIQSDRETLAGIANSTIYENWYRNTYWEEVLDPNLNIDTLEGAIIEVVNDTDSFYRTIKELDLSFNSLRYYIDSINLVNAESISFKNNFLDSINYIDAPNLKYLDISSNNLFKLPLLTVGTISSLLSNKGKIDLSRNNFNFETMDRYYEKGIELITEPQDVPMQLSLGKDTIFCSDLSEGNTFTWIKDGQVIQDGEKSYLPISESGYYEVRVTSSWYGWDYTQGISATIGSVIDSKNFNSANLIGIYTIMGQSIDFDSTSNIEIIIDTLNAGVYLFVFDSGDKSSVLVNIPGK